LYDFWQAEELIKFMSLSVLGLPTMELLMAGTSFRGEAKEGYEMTSETQLPLIGGVVLEASFTLSEEEEEDEEGNTVVALFTRRESFTTYIPATPILLWDSTWRFGYTRLSDGTCECYLKGDRYYGPFPTRLLMLAHWYFVGKLVEKHINSPEFGGDPEVAEEKLANIPSYLVKNYVRSLRGEVEKVKAAQQAEHGDALHPAAREQLAKLQATIDQLRALEEKQLKAQMATSTTLRRRASSVAGGEEEEERTRQTAQLQIADKATRKTLQAAITTISEKGDDGKHALAASIQTIAADPALQYKQIKTRLTSKPSRKASVGASK